MTAREKLSQQVLNLGDCYDSKVEPITLDSYPKRGRPRRQATSANKPAGFLVIMDRYGGFVSCEGEV